MLLFIFWNIFGFNRFDDWSDALSWVLSSSVFVAQETLDHAKVTPLPDKTPLRFPARKPDGPGRPAGGLTTYFDNKRLGAATLDKIFEQQFFLCVRVTLPNCSFIVGNVYLHLHTPGHSDNLVEELQAIIDGIIDAHPTTPFIFGGDFNCHLFSLQPGVHEQQF